MLNEPKLNAMGRPDFQPVVVRYRYSGSAFAVTWGYNALVDDSDFAQFRQSGNVRGSLSCPGMSLNIWMKTGNVLISSGRSVQR